MTSQRPMQKDLFLHAEHFKLFYIFVFVYRLHDPLRLQFFLQFKSRDQNHCKTEINSSALGHI